MAACLPYLPTLTFLNLEVLTFILHHSRIHPDYPKGTSFDDFGLEQLGRHVPSLLTLNVARTRVSDRGLVELQVWRVFSKGVFFTNFGLQGALHQLTFCILLSNRVSTEGVVSLLVDHPNLITLEYERMKEGLALLASSPDLAKRGFQLRKVVLESCREEDVEALENCKNILPLLEAISLNNSSLTPRLAISLGQFAHLEKLELGNSMFTQYTAR